MTSLLSRRHLLGRAGAVVAVSATGVVAAPALAEKQLDTFCPSELVKRASVGGFCFLPSFSEGRMTVYLSQRLVSEKFSDAVAAVAEMMKTETRRDVVKAYFANTDEHCGKTFIEIYGAPFEVLGREFVQVDRVSLIPV